MTVHVTPALEALLATVGEGRAFAQVWIRPDADGWRLTHVADRDRPPDGLAVESVASLRDRARTTAGGEFRPLKTAPNLTAGWVCQVDGAGPLSEALENLYPGAVADWYAARQEPVPATSFRDYVGRQTGMYRGARDLADDLAAAAVRACCHPRFCCRRRLWEAPGLAPDGPGEKSDVPCLEPCALMLEFARRTQRLERDPKVGLELAPGDLATLAEVLGRALEEPAQGIREGDTSAPGNPRRIQLLLEKLHPHLGRSRDGAAEE